MSVPRTVRVECDGCGAVEVNHTDMVIYRHRGMGADPFQYVLRCPICRMIIVHTCSLPIVRLLTEAGVRVHAIYPSPELREWHPSGPPFCADDVLDFHLLLDRTSTIGEWTQTLRAK